MRSLIVTCFAFSLVHFACDETLPARDEPQKFLSAVASIDTGAVVFEGGSLQGRAGSFGVIVTNKYSEVLQAEEYARVELDVWLRDRPDKRGKIIATTRDVQNPEIIHAGQLTLLPNASAIFDKQWSHRTTDSTGFWQFVRLTPKVNGHGDHYLESDPVPLVAGGKVQVFRNVQPEKLPEMQFSIVYRLF